MRRKCASKVPRAIDTFRARILKSPRELDTFPAHCLHIFCTFSAHFLHIFCTFPAHFCTFSHISAHFTIFLAFLGHFLHGDEIWSKGLSVQLIKQVCTPFSFASVGTLPDQMVRCTTSMLPARVPKLRHISASLSSDESSESSVWWPRWPRGGL